MRIRNDWLIYGEGRKNNAFYPLLIYRDYNSLKLSASEIVRRICSCDNDEFSLQIV